MQQRAFTPGQELEEARTLWKVARLKVIFDEHWMQTLLTGQSIAAPTVAVPMPSSPHTLHATDQDGLHFPHIDWGEAFDVSTFYGRKAEFAQLKDWVLKDRCRLIALLDIGGMDKLTLAITLMHVRLMVGSLPHAVWMEPYASGILRHFLSN